MDKMFRQLLKFSPENIQMICESARYIREWKDTYGSDCPTES